MKPAMPARPLLTEFIWPAAADRLIIGLVLLGVVTYIWAELAVGIFTNWGS